MSRSRKILLAKIALLLGSMVVALLIGEAALRLAGFRYILYPDKIEFGWPDPEEFDNVYVSDPEVLWRQENYPTRLKTAEEGGVDVVFMGCSCTEFGKYDQYLVEHVEHEHPGKSVSYLNTGVGGWTTFQGLQQLRRDVIKLNPKYITIFYGWNDHWMGFGVQDKEVASFNSSVLYPFRNVRWVQLAAMLWVRLTDQPDAQYPRRVTPADFRANLEAMVAEARAAEITPILFTAPTSYLNSREPAYLASRWLPDPRQVLPVHQEYVDIVREIAATEDVLLCDLAAKFDALPRRIVTRQYFKTDGIHLRPEGDRKMAEFILEDFREFGILDDLLQDKGELVQLPGRDYPGGGEAVPPVKKEGDPELPTVVDFTKTRLRSKSGKLQVQGRVLSPHPIDFVVIHANGENLGSAYWPRYNPQNLQQYPEYDDAWSDFYFERIYAPLAGEDSVEIRVDLWSGENIIDSRMTTAE